MQGVDNCNRNRRIAPVIKSADVWKLLDFIHFIQETPLIMATYKALKLTLKSKSKAVY